MYVVFIEIIIDKVGCLIDHTKISILFDIKINLFPFST